MAEVSIVFEASDALYEPEGVLWQSDQPARLEIGPFEYVQITYDTIRTNLDGAAVIACLESDGCWHLDLDCIFGSDVPSELENLSEPRFSDIVISG